MERPGLIILCMCWALSESTLFAQVSGLVYRNEKVKRPEKQMSGIYVDKGNPYSLGLLNVSTITVTETGDSSPLHTELYFPSKADEYPVIFFVGGLNGYIWVEWYTLYLRMLAAHGFFIIGVDYKFPANPHTYDNKLSQDVSKFFQEIDFLKTFLRDNPKLQGSTPYWNKTGLLCHSSGCDCTLRMIRQDSSRFNSTVFLEPFSIDALIPMNDTNIIPAMMYGTQLASEGLIPCSISGLDYKQFYEIWKCPRIVVEVAEFGHCDILNPFQWEACHITKVCATTNDTRLPEYRKFVQGATVSFFITELQGRPDAINYITDQSKSPLRLLLDKSDLNC